MYMYIWERFGKRDLLAIFHIKKYDAKCGACLHKFDCRETSLSNAANHLEIFLIECEICLYKHLHCVYIRNPLFRIVVFISMLWQLKVNIFYKKKKVFQLYKTSKSATTFDRGLVPLTVCSIDKTNIFFTFSMKKVLFILDILFNALRTCLGLRLNDRISLVEIHH